MRNKTPQRAALAEKPVRRRIPKWALQSGEASSADGQYYLRTIGRALEVLDCSGTFARQLQVGAHIRF
jgi:hypothetical protein